MEGYCIKCRAVMKMKDIERKIEGGKRIISGSCVKCGTKIFNIEDLKEEALEKDFNKAERFNTLLVWIAFGLSIYLLLKDLKSFLFFVLGITICLYLIKFSEDSRRKFLKLMNYVQEKARKHTE